MTLTDADLTRLIAAVGRNGRLIVAQDVYEALAVHTKERGSPFGAEVAILMTSCLKPGTALALPDDRYWHPL